MRDCHFHEENDMKDTNTEPPKEQEIYAGDHIDDIDREFYLEGAGDA